MARALLTWFSEVYVTHFGEVREPHPFGIVAERLEEYRGISHMR